MDSKGVTMLYRAIVLSTTGSEINNDFPISESLQDCRDVLKNRTSPAGIWVTKHRWYPWHAVSTIQITGTIDHE